MEEGTVVSRLKSHMAALQESISSGLRGLCGGCSASAGPRLWLVRRLHIRTAVYMLLGITVVSLICLSQRVNNLSATQVRENLKPAPFQTDIRKSQRNVLSNTKQTLVHQKSFSLNGTLIQESVELHQAADDDDVRAPFRKPFNFTPSKEFTVVILTYNRSDILLRLLNHYSAMSNLDRIVVIWNNLNATPLVDEWEWLGPHPVPVRFIAQQENRLRNRFQPFPEIQTSAVLLVDDDLMISARDVQFALRVWKRFPHLIVGFFPRKHVRSKRGFYSYGSFELDSGRGDQESSFEYSMVLTGAGFVHRHYLTMFNDSMVIPKSVLQLVDDLQNCEDIAMNVMVSQYLASIGQPQCSGLYVKPIDLRNLEKESTTGYVGVWHDPSHLAERSYCLTRLAEIYGRLPLKYSDIMMMPMYAEAMRCPN